MALIGGTAALVMGGPETVIVGGWITVAAAIIGIAGGVLAEARPGLAALLMAMAMTAVAAVLVAPGVIPAIADTIVVFLDRGVPRSWCSSIVVFLGYLSGGALLRVGAIVAVVGRKRAADMPVQ